MTADLMAKTLLKATAKWGGDWLNFQKTTTSPEVSLRPFPKRQRCIAFIAEHLPGWLGCSFLG
jgi:hypothetical protein